jgi:hypothetical protein
MNNIIHLIISYSDKDVYACNHACGTTKEKSTFDGEKVTCKNCLKLMTSGKIYCQKRKLKWIED